LQLYIEQLKVTQGQGSAEREALGDGESARCCWCLLVFRHPAVLLHGRVLRDDVHERIGR
jgi:hypothetical protein